MKRAELTVDLRYEIGDVTARHYGLFLEAANGHLSQGVFAPGSSGANAHGFLSEAVDEMRGLKPGFIRFPGGNNMATYDWKNGIGPGAQRRASIMPAHSTPDYLDKESNDVGVDEFAALLEDVGAEGMMTVNLCTGTLRDALELIEYCAVDGGTYWSDLRRRYASEAPYRQIRCWYLGNEVDGDWIIGQHTAQTYGRAARETAKLIKSVLPDASVALCGSSSPTMSSYPMWNVEVLDQAFDYVDILSIHDIHICVPPPGMSADGPRIGFEDIAYIGVELDRFIEGAQAAIRLVQAKHRSVRPIVLSVDEWNVDGLTDTVPPDGPWTERAAFSPGTVAAMSAAHIPPHFQRPVTVLDAVVFSSFFLSFINHSDVVAYAGKCLFFDGVLCVAGGRLLRSVAYDVYALFSTFMRGRAIRQVLDAPLTDTKRFGRQPAVQTACVYRESEQTLTVAAVNLDLSEEIELKVHIADTDARLFRIDRLHDPQPLCANTFERPDRIHAACEWMREERDAVALPPVSLTLFHYRIAPRDCNRRGGEAPCAG